MSNRPTYEELEQRIKELEEEKNNLQEMEVVASTIFSSSGEGIIVYDNDLIVRGWNKFMENLSGMTKEDVIGKNALDLFPHLKKTGLNKLMEQALNGKTVASEFVPFKSPVTGREGWSQGTYSPLLSGDGNITGIIAIIHDVTQRKRVEEALQESEEKYRSMMEAMDDAIYISSADFLIDYMNPAMIERIGRYTADEHCYSVIHGLDEKCPWCVHEKVMKGENIKYEQVSPKDDKTYNISNLPIFHTNGSVSKLTIFRDITEIQKMGAQLQQSQKMEAIGTLAGGVAHDFNNILFPIIGYTEMMLDDAPEGSDLRGCLNEILTASLRAGDLVKQILTFSRQVEKEQKPLKVQIIIREVIKLIRASLPSTIAIKQHIDKKCKMVLADPTHIHQIAMNLMTNAYHAMEKDGGPLTIGLSEASVTTEHLGHLDLNPGTFICFSVCDTGHGIKKHILERIFEPYFTTKDQGKGTGLGLSVVHGIVKSYKGDILVHSEPGKGTEFKVYLPAIDSEQEKTRSQIDQLPVQGGDEHILLVDDEEPILKMEKQMLERLGYRVTSRASSVEALEAFRSSPDRYDLVITDMTMPNMTGEKLTFELKHIRKEIPVIIYTGFSERISKEKAEALGIDGFLMKPIVKSELDKKIRAILDIKKGG